MTKLPSPLASGVLVASGAVTMYLGLLGLSAAQSSGAMIESIGTALKA